MPNELSDAIHAVVNWTEDEAKAFVAAIDHEWVQVRPEVVSIGKSLASEVMTAAVAYFTGGATLAQAIASVVEQLPAELKDLEHVIVTLFGLAVTKLKADSDAAAQAA